MNSPLKDMAVSLVNQFLAVSKCMRFFPRTLNCGLLPCSNGINIKTGMFKKKLFCGHCDWFDEETTVWWKKSNMTPLAQEVTLARVLCANVEDPAFYPSTTGTHPTSTSCLDRLLRNRMGSLAGFAEKDLA